MIKINKTEKLAKFEFFTLFFNCPHYKFLKVMKLRNNNNQKLLISVETEYNQNKIQSVFIYFKLIFWLTISSTHFQSKINKIYILAKL